MATHTSNDASLLIRLPSELKAELMRAAAINGQKVNTEVVERLQKSRQATPDYSAAHTPTLLHTNEKGPGSSLSGTDQAMLDIFRKLPIEKQLALLSLFR